MFVNNFSFFAKNKLIYSCIPQWINRMVQSKMMAVSYINPSSVKWFVNKSVLICFISLYFSRSSFWSFLIRVELHLGVFWGWFPCFFKKTWNFPFFFYQTLLHPSIFVFGKDFLLTSPGGIIKYFSRRKWGRRVHTKMNHFPHTFAALDLNFLIFSTFLR